MNNGTHRDNDDSKKIARLDGVGMPLPVCSSLPLKVDGTLIKLTKKGWYLIHRQIWDDDEFPEEPFTELQAWMWIIGAASFKDKTVFFNKQNIELKRGQFVTSYRQLAKIFYWSKKKAQNFLKRLEKLGKIRGHTRDTKYTILTICNYETYQDMRDNQGTVRGTQKGQQGDSRGTGLTNDNEGKERKELKDIPARPDSGKPTSESEKKDPTHGYICKAIVDEIKSKLGADCPYPLAGKIIQRAGWKAGETYPWGLYGHIMVCIGRVSTWVSEQAFIGAITKDLKCRHGNLDGSFAWPEADLTLIKAFENKFELWIKSEFPQKMKFEIGG